MPELLEPFELDEELLDEVGRRFERVVTVEDGVVRGGVGSTVRDFFDRRGYRTQVRSLGIPDDRFVEHGTPAELFDGSHPVERWGLCRPTVAALAASLGIEAATAEEFCKQVICKEGSR